MRKLSVKQKKILDKQTALFTDQLPQEVYEQVNAVNCYENMDSDIDRYLHDRNGKNLHRNRW